MLFSVPFFFFGSNCRIADFPSSASYVAEIFRATMAFAQPNDGFFFFDGRWGGGRLMMTRFDGPPPLSTYLLYIHVCMDSLRLLAMPNPPPPGPPSIHY